MHHGLNTLITEEYGEASGLMAGIERLRHSWGSIAPPPPVRRGDVMLLGFLILREKHGEPAPTLGEMAKVLHKSPPGITQKVNALEEQGFLRRTASKQDKRAACVQLTPKGREFAQRALRNFWGQVEVALEKMGKEDTGQLINLLNKLSDAIEETAKTRPDAK